jgi:CRP-like cAMP-binding protein
MDEETPIPLNAQRDSTRVERLTTLQKAEYLRSIGIFSQATVEELFILATVTRQIALAQDQVVFRENDFGEALYVVIEGEVELRCRESGVREVIGPGHSFGVSSTLTRGPRTLAAKALKDTFALCLVAEDLFRAVSQHTEIVSSICKYLVRMAKEDTR